MSRWGFSRESGFPADGANTVAGIEAGYQPFNEADNIASKRNVIATSRGWVRRQNYTDVHGNARVKEEVLVAAHPGSGLGYNSNTYLGNPDIAQIYVKLNANNTLSANVSANLYVVFNSPIRVKPSSNAMSITVANTIGGEGANAVFTAQTASNLIGANNTLVFSMPALQGGAGSVAATYTINAQSITVAGGGNPIYNPEQTTTHAANLVITGAVSNNLLDGAGLKITTFTVTPGG